MSLLHTYLESIINNEINSKQIFYCAICNIKLTYKHEWIAHVNGRAHVSKPRKLISENVCLEDLISKSEYILGDCNEFIVRRDLANAYKFDCLQCGIELNSYFALREHIEQINHMNTLKQHHLTEERKNHSLSENVSELSKDDEVETTENITVANRLSLNSYELKKSNSMAVRLPADREASLADTVDAVAILRKNFFGRLICTLCEQRVELDVSAVEYHFRNCNRKNNEQKSIEDRFIQYAKFYITNGNESDLKNLICADREMNVVIKDKVSHLQSSFRSFMNIRPEIFKCTSCNVTGDISKWKDHCINHHLSSSEQTNENCIACTCLMCNILVYGTRDRVVLHSHFQAPYGVEYFAMNAYPYLRNVLQPSAEMPRYYKFCCKLTQRSTEKDSVRHLAFYCLACDCYGMRCPKKHFKAATHKDEIHPMYEFRYCNQCNVVFYSDLPLFEDHGQSLAHIAASSVFDNNMSVVVDDEHQFLLLRIKNIISNFWSDYRAMSNFQVIGYWCNPCRYQTCLQSEWKSHLMNESHTALVQNQNDYFEHPCVICKLRILGTIQQHVAHFASSEHLSIKSLVLHRYNYQRFSEKRFMSNYTYSEIDSCNENVQIRNFSEFLYDTTTKNTSLNTSIVNSNPTGCKEVDRAGKDKRIYTDLDADPCLLKIDASNLEAEVNIREFIQKVSNTEDRVWKLTFQCWFCSQYFHKERSWWCHLKQPSHIEKVVEYYNGTKVSNAICICCRLCMRLTLGAYITLSRHVTSKTHQLARSKSAPGIVASINSNKKIKNKDSPLSTDDSINKLTNGVTTIKQSDRLISSQSVDTDVTVSNSDKCDAYNEDLISDEEKKEEEDEDADEELYYLLMNSDSDAEKTVTSDEEREKFMLGNELKTNTDVDEKCAVNSCDKAGNDKKIVQTAVSRGTRGGVVVKGIPVKVLKNRRLMYQTFSRYIVIKGMYSKKKEPGCLHLIVKEPEESFKVLQKNIIYLKTKLGTSELIVECGKKKNDSAGVLMTISDETKLLFSNMMELEDGIRHLISKYDKETNSPLTQQKIGQLESDLIRLASLIYKNTVTVKTYIFGSRVTGLAAENSDVDVYLQIGNSFRGSMHDNADLQQQLVVLFAKEMRRHPNVFRNITPIAFAFVPIVTFTHVASNLKCDLSFRSGLSTMNSTLVKTYLELDNRIKFLVCAVKLWMKLNDLADRNLFTSYAQIWMVLFFLMQPQIAVVPTVIALKFMLPCEQQEFTVEGWNCSFPNIRNIIWRSSCQLNVKELLFKFFEFYSDESLINYVLCTLTGIRIPKKHFIDCYDSLPLVFQTFRTKIKTDHNLSRKVFSDFESLCVQDPFDHCHNLTKTINKRKFACFVELCKKTMEILK